MYQPEKHGIKERMSGQYALYHSLLGILKLYAIYTPHIADYIYQQYFRRFEKEKSIHQTIWRVQKEEAVILEFGRQLEEIIAEVRRYKSEHQLSMKDEIPEITITCHSRMIKLFKQTEKDLRACTNAGKIIYHS